MIIPCAYPRAAGEAARAVVTVAAIMFTVRGAPGNGNPAGTAAAAPG